MTDTAVEKLSTQASKLSFYDQIMGHKTEDQIYQSYFEQTFWTIEEFAALMTGITPEKYAQLLLELKNDVSSEYFKENQDTLLKDSERLTAANKLYLAFITRLRKVFSSKEIHLSNSKIVLSPWKFIKWIAINGIRVKSKFFNELPLHLMEIYLEFQPIKTTIRTEPKWNTNYHRALYLQHAENLIKRSKKKITPEEIYNHPQMEWVRRTFKDAQGKQVIYKKRTIKESWLSKVYPKKRGRPSKS